MADMIDTLTKAPPHPFNDLVKPLYWPYRIVQNDEVVDEWRKKVETYLDTFLLMFKISNCALTTVPNMLIMMRPPQFNYAYQNRTNPELFIKMSTFYRAILPAMMNYVSPLARPPTPGRKIKVGFVSNMISKLSSVLKDRVGIMQHLDRSRFEVTAFMFDEPKDEMVKACYANIQVVVLPRSFDARKYVESANLDILVYCDLNMCGEAFVLSHNRLAPRQITTFGHSETSGISTIDAYVSSELYEIKKDRAQSHFSERLILHKSLCMYYYQPIDSVGISKFGPRSKFHLPSKHTLFLCFQSPFKIMPGFHTVMKAIVDADPTNILVFTPGFLGQEEDIEFYETLEKAVDYKNQLIVFRERINYVDIHNLISVCDVILDTFPFTGCNTSLESFNVGRPVVTLPSDYLNGRFTAGFYEFMAKKGGADSKRVAKELVCSNIEDYIAKCLRLGKDLEYRAYCSNTILKASPLLWCDQESVAEWDVTLTELCK